MATVNNGREHGQSGIKEGEEVWSVSDKPGYALILIHNSNFVFTSNRANTDQLSLIIQSDLYKEIEFHGEPNHRNRMI